MKFPVKPLLLPAAINKNEEDAFIDEMIKKSSKIVDKFKYDGKAHMSSASKEKTDAKKALALAKEKKREENNFIEFDKTAIKFASSAELSIVYAFMLKQIKNIDGMPSPEMLATAWPAIVFVATAKREGFLCLNEIGIAKIVSDPDWTIKFVTDLMQTYVPSLEEIKEANLIYDITFKGTPLNEETTMVHAWTPASKWKPYVGNLAPMVPFISPATPPIKKPSDEMLQDKIDEIQDKIDQIADLEKLLKNQQDLLRDLTIPPHHYATVLFVKTTLTESSVTILHGGFKIKVPFPKAFCSLDGSILSDTPQLTAGDTVVVHPTTFQIMDKSHFALSGEVATYKKSFGGEAEVEVGNKKIIVCGATSSFKEGDRVLLDASHSIILSKISNMDGATSLDNVKKVTFADIGGLDEIKERLVEEILWPVKHKDLYKQLGKVPAKGAMLIGPPGVGKTLIGKALANFMSETYGKEVASSGGFIYVKCAEILDKFVGGAESKIANIFITGEEFFNKHSVPPVFFWDECDALFRKRGSGISSDVENSIVPTLLNRLDGLTSQAGFHIFSTNLPNVIDPALLRDGRIDLKLYIPRPTLEVTKTIFKIHFKPMVIKDEDAFVEKAVNFLWKPDFALKEVVTESGETHLFGLKDAISGAMIANIVSTAKSNALRRSIKSMDAPTDTLEPCEITSKDMGYAIKMVWEQNLEMLHEEAFKEFTSNLNSPVKAVLKIRL